jgi:hypothetical protein
MTQPLWPIRRAFIEFGRHLPVPIGLLAIAAAAPVWVWVRQETSVTLNVFFGGRQIVIVICGGIAVGCLAAEFFALLAGHAPGDRPLRSLRNAAFAALPFYAVMVWLGAAMQD